MGNVITLKHTDQFHSKSLGFLFLRGNTQISCKTSVIPHTIFRFYFLGLMHNYTMSKPRRKSLKIQVSKAVQLHAMKVPGGERRYTSYSFLTLALDEGEWSASRPSRALPPGKGCRYPLNMRLGGPQSWSGCTD
jgi:hypothetical protein